jgi:hypothetical protein
MRRDQQRLNDILDALDSIAKVVARLSRQVLRRQVSEILSAEYEKI